MKWQLTFSVLVSCLVCRPADGRPQPQGFYPGFGNNHHCLIDSVNDHLGEDTAEDIVANQNQEAGWALMGNTYYKKGPPIVVDQNGRVIGGDNEGGGGECGGGGETMILRNVGPEVAPDPSKINLDHIPGMPVNMVVHLRQPYIIEMQESPGPTGSSAEETTEEPSTPGGEEATGSEEPTTEAGEATTPTGSGESFPQSTEAGQ